MTTPSLVISFDPTTWKPTSVLLNGEMDIETEKLAVIADKMLGISRIPKRFGDDS